MSTVHAKSSRAKRFTNFADFDLFIQHRFLDEVGIERHYLEVGAVRRLKTYFDRLEHQLRCMASTKVPIFHRHQRGVELTLHARILWTVLRDADSEAPSGLSEGRLLNPWLKLGLLLARKWAPKLRPYAITNPNELDVNDDRARWLMEHVVKVIRRVCNSRQFRSQVNNDNRKARDNYMSCAGLMMGLLRRHSRLLILRVDLYYEGDAKVFSASKSAERSYMKFLRNLRESQIVPDVLAYIGRRENGLDKQIHFHILVAVAGDLHQDAYHLAERLRDFWVDECVGSTSLASAYNCWHRRHEYEFNCIGLLHYADTRMLMGLREAIEYLCKARAYVLVLPQLGRNLRKSVSHRGIEGARRCGAPRKYDPCLSAAKQILFTHDLQKQQFARVRRPRRA